MQQTQRIYDLLPVQFGHLGMSRKQQCAQQYDATGAKQNRGKAELKVEDRAQGGAAKNHGDRTEPSSEVWSLARSNV